MISFREIIKLFYIFSITIQHTVTKIRIHFRIKTIKPTIWKKKTKIDHPKKISTVKSTIKYQKNKLHTPEHKEPLRLLTRRSDLI